MSEDKNFLKKYNQIEQSSDQWKVLEFKIQLSLGTTAASLKKVYNISNTHVSSAFSNYAQGGIVLQSFVQAQKLTENNTLQKVCLRGFDIGEEGMVYNVGYNRNIDIKTQKIFSLLVCKIATGKSYCYSANKYRQTKIECQPGFDSLYLYNEQQNPQVFLQKYVVFKNCQVYPTYLVDFTIDAYKQQQSKHPVCDNCNKTPPNQAKYYCQTEDAHFCYECDQQYHNSSKLGSKHNRFEISDKPKKFGNCSKHEDSQLQLYCRVCYEALCVNCKITGDHSSGEMGQHQLLKLKEAYSEISSKVKQMDPNIERRKNQLTEDLSNIDLKIKEVNSKATLVQEQIYVMFQKVLQQLHLETQKKLSFLIGDQLQLKRQFDHIQWMQSFLRYSLEVQDPSAFLQSYYKYSKYRKQVLSLNNLSINTQVKADMKLQGNLYVACEQNVKRDFNTKNTKLNPTHSPIVGIETPAKTTQKITDKDRDIGSTQLRKTVFKKHYLDKSKNVGSEPNFSKGNYDIRMPPSNNIN